MSKKTPSFGWDVKPRSWLSVVIKNPTALLVKSRGVTTATIATTGPCQSWPPNNPHPLDWLYLSLSSPPVADVWWAHWRRCPVAAVASSKWMLHTGGGWGETPHMIVKRFGCTAIHKKRYINASFIHSFIHSFHSFIQMLKCSWGDSQSSSGDAVHVFMSSFSEAADIE